MSRPHQTEFISIPRQYGAFERELIGNEIIQTIRQRTLDGINKFGRPFKRYTDNYAKTMKFQAAGKSQDDPNLKLTGDMLRGLSVLSHGTGYIKIGFADGTPENDKAWYATEWKREFLGLAPGELSSILSHYPISQDVREQLGPEVFDQIADAILRDLFSEPE